MSAVDFPNSPSIGQIQTINNITRRWDGITWSIVPTTIQGPTGASGPSILGATDPILWDSSARTLSFNPSPTFTDLYVQGLSYTGTPAVDANTNDAYTNPIAILAGDYDDYTQVAIKNPNSSVNSSADIIVYPDNGNDSYGWMDMGVTSSTFADPTFTITGVNDGYLFSSAPKPIVTVVSAVNNAGTVTVTTDVPHGFIQTQTHTVTSAVGTATGATYYAYNNFNIGQTVTVAGLPTTTGSTLNISNQVVTYADSAKFQIGSTTVGTSVGPGTATGASQIRLELIDADITGAYYYVPITSVPTTPNIGGTAYPTTFTFLASAVQSIPSTANTTAPLVSNLANISSTWFPTGNGNLVLATDRGGVLNDIVFGAAGLASNNAQMRISAFTEAVTIYKNLLLPNNKLATTEGGTGGNYANFAALKTALGVSPTSTVYNLVGTLTTQTGTQKLVFPSAATIVDVTLGAGTAPTGAAANFDILKNNTTIFASTKPSIAISAVTGGPFIPTTTAVSAGQYLTVNVTQTGSTIPGTDITVIIRYITT